LTKITVLYICVKTELTVKHQLNTYLLKHRTQSLYMNGGLMVY